MVWATGWLWLDPGIAILVAANILHTGWQLLRRSADGLMDVALPTETLNVIEEVMNSYRREGIDFDALRTRQAGVYACASLHVVVPGDWTVQKGHDYAERIEADLRVAVPHLHVITHLEPKNHSAAPMDGPLDRS